MLHFLHLGLETALNHRHILLFKLKSSLWLPAYEFGLEEISTANVGV